MPTIRGSGPTYYLPPRRKPPPKPPSRSPYRAADEAVMVVLVVLMVAGGCLLFVRFWRTHVIGAVEGPGGSGSPYADPVPQVPPAPLPSRGGSHRIYEPSTGCYIGAIIERDDHVQRDYATFNNLCGKKHAVFFDYRTFGNALQTAQVKRAWAQGAAYQIALEPHGGMQTLLQGSHLETFALQCREAGAPIFLRLASEMNGNWVPWHGNPQQYVAVWRKAYQVMRQYAPNVAMVWAPNAVPTSSIAAYYPGDAFVDWVGVNFYVVHHHNGDVNQPATSEDPLHDLDYVYRRYADRKPLMVCETAVTHRCVACGQDVSQWAANRIRRIYRELPSRYPKLDAICWYNIDNIARAAPGRNTNDFSLTSDALVLDAYRAAIKPSYFVSAVEIH